MQLHPEIERAAQGLFAALKREDPNATLEFHQQVPIMVKTTDGAQYIIDTVITAKGNCYHYALMQRPDGTVYNIPVVEA